MESLKSISFNEKLLERNPPLCDEHQSVVIAICTESICNSKPICVNCLIQSHFKDHDQKNIIPLKEYLEKLDDYFESRLDRKDDLHLLETKTVYLDVLENFKQETDVLVETLKNNIYDHFSIYEDRLSNMNMTEKIYSNIFTENNPIISLCNELTRLDISFNPQNRQFNSINKESNQNIILNDLKLAEFLTRVDELCKNLKKKLVIPSKHFFRTFNLSDDKIVKITETSEGINFKKVGNGFSTFLVISNEHLDFKKTITWKIKPINLPSKWMGVGILPKDKFKREGWNSTDLIGLNCDKYYLDRGTNKSSGQWQVNTQSNLTFTFNGPEATLNIENSNPKFEVTAKSLDSNIEYCLALFFHYADSEILLMN